MIVISIAILFALISSITCAFINGSTRYNNLKVGDNVEISVAVSLAESEILVLFKITLNEKQVIAQDSGSNYDVTNLAKDLFGNRISSSSSGYNYKLRITDLRVNDSMTLQMNLFFLNSTVPGNAPPFEISINVNGGVGGVLHSEKDANTGMIVGIVIGVLVFIAIVIVATFLVYRYKKSHPSSTSPKESVILNPKQKNDDTYSHYAASTVSVKSEDRKPPTQQYAELGLGGGRDGPKPKTAPSNYSQVKTDDLGYPAKGPTAQSKPSSDYIDTEVVEENGIIV